MLTSQEASHARFFNLSLRHAIDIEQVDAFMNRLIGTLRHYEHTGRLHPDGYTADEVLNITFRPARGHQGYAMSAVDAVRQEAEATLRYYEGNMASPAPEQRPALTRINRVKQLTPHTSLNQPHATQGASARPTSATIHHIPQRLRNDIPLSPSSPAVIDTDVMPADLATLTGTPAPAIPSHTAAPASPVPVNAEPVRHHTPPSPSSAQSPAVASTAPSHTVQVPQLAPMTGELPAAPQAPFAGPRGLSGAELAHDIGRAMHARAEIAQNAPHRLTHDLTIKAATPHGTVTVTGVLMGEDGQIILQTY